jgi:signal peptidase I
MEQGRSFGARIGIAFLNLLTPGLGLLRLGKARAAAGYIAAPIFFIMALTALAATGAQPNFPVAAVIVAIAIAGTVILYIGAVAHSWRASRDLVADTAWWSRWYGLVLATSASWLLAQASVAMLHGFYKPFYVPAASMAPTLLPNDKILADMRVAAPPRIGDVVLIAFRDQVRVARVIAVGGQRIAVHDGVPVIDGRPARQHFVGTLDDPDLFLPDSGIARKSRETLPGAAVKAHDVLDLMPTELDEMAEAIVPEGHIFVMGDNRDQAADSRVDAARNGVGMIPSNDIRGRPLFIYWSRDRSRIGAVLNDSD